MRAPRLILYLPDLSAAIRAAGAGRLPIVEKLVARALNHPVADDAAVLAECFGMRLDGMPVAPLEWLGLTGGRDQGCWWRAEPVHLLVDRDQLAMAPRRMLAVTPEEARALAASFNDCFAPDQYVLETPQPDIWYLRAPRAWRCHTWDPTHVESRAITGFMPSGPDEDALRKLMNETQMLFHEHPVNQERERAGRLAINSLWLWGGGNLPERVPRTPGRVVSNLPLVRGLARLAGCSCEPWTGGLTPVSNGDAVLIACGMHDFDNQLERLQAELLRPGWAALMRAHVRSLECFPGGPCSYVLTRRGAFRFWRRHPLADVPRETDDYAPD